MLNEPADLIQEILAEYRSGRDSLGERPWGHGDDIAKVFEEKFVPGAEKLEEYLDVLTEVLRETGLNTVDNAEALRRADLGGEEIGLDLVRNMPDTPGDPGGIGDLGGLPGGRYGRG
ncbi:hypothetical protein [Nocardiopsis sp. MG754419]|uniref:hypothetical protein n=1 Tax=Nocardiopsis sp. MG754419 TaxID=2259865 RepID=UPI001BADCCD1|nr:hypothetical protein [Nocardiopsis sp. MG754419]MBR8743376.1 hypothetical protein [Nocardiopsis sp. MG754419]